MWFVRYILAFAIALSLAAVPFGSLAAAHAMTNDDAPGMHMAGGHGSAVATHDCCPDDIKPASPADHSRCGDGFCCTGFAIALGAPAFQSLLPQDVPATALAIPADQVLAARSGSPPFRPPRV